MTLLEILVVLALLAALSALVVGATRKVTAAELREKTGDVATFLRQAYMLAALGNMHHRVVINLDEQSFSLEQCPDLVLLKKSEEEESEEEKTAKERLMEKIAEGQKSVAANPEIAEAESPEDALKRAAALEGVRLGNTRCEIAKALGGGDALERKLESEDVKIKRIFVQHLKEPITEGKATINFFPLGYAEKAVIELADKDDDSMFVLVHRLTGRIEIKDDDKYDPEAHMRRSTAGREVDDR